MKWREPWWASLQNQVGFSLFSRRVRRGFLLWLLIFGIIFALAAVREDTAPGLVDRLWIAPVWALVMSILLYTVWWLSPRKIDSGPRGIVVTKADEMTVIPWNAIATYRISTNVMPGTLHLALGSGEQFQLTLSARASPKEIEAEIRQKTGVQI